MVAEHGERLEDLHVARTVTTWRAPHDQHAAQLLRVAVGHDGRRHAPHHLGMDAELRHQRLIEAAIVLVNDLFEGDARVERRPSEARDACNLL